jgi:hypothetical protein
MAKRVGQDDIKNINEIYYKTKSYAETARQTGFSASTVKKYIVPNFVPALEIEVKRFNLKKDLPNFTTKLFIETEDWGTLCELSNEEREQMKEFWKELTI